MVEKKTIVILSVTSDIGKYLAKQYSEQGHVIVGTYRSKDSLDELKQIPISHFFFCDVDNKNSIAEFVREFKNLGLKWDLFISCIGTQKPIGRFFNTDFDQWSDSIHTNALEQLRILHELYPFKNKNRISSVVFFAGGGVNKATKNYSAYTISKILLIKMCELLDFENEDINIFIIGPGWVKTKIHYETLNESREKSEENYEKTLEFMQTGLGTSLEEIFNCINWLCEQGKQVASGRNFSVVYDQWKGERNKELANALKSNIDMYKLRRSGNEWK